MGSRARGGYAEQLADLVLGLSVPTSTEVDRGLAAVATVEVVGRPVLVGEGVPDRHVVVEGHRVVDAELLDGASHVGVVLLEVELRGVDADDHQAVPAIAVVPGAQARDRPYAVHARIGP